MISLIGNLVYSVLCLIVLVVLVMPFTNKKIERNLEIFLFVMGVLSVLVSNQMSMELLLKALEEPFMIAAAVLDFCSKNTTKTYLKPFIAFNSLCHIKFWFFLSLSSWD